MKRGEIGTILPLPPAERWKFAGALPEPLFFEMVLSDHYHVEEFLDTIRNLTVSVLHDPTQRFTKTPKQ
jgi:hypothetical protein